MTDNKVWFITGAGRGMGIDIAKAALAAGHAVVATGRDAERVRDAIGEHDDLLAVALDITDPDAADAAAEAAVERFGRIDVLVNNAGNFYAGFFEEISPEQYRRQMETNFFGPLNVTRAILPIMRKQRSGHVITISSTAGLVGVDFCSAYSASKFALEGFMETLALDVAPFGITRPVVEPGLLPHRAARRGLVDDLARAVDRRLRRPHEVDHRGVDGHERRAVGRPGEARRRPRRPSPTRGEPPLRFLAGADAIETAEQKARTLLEQADAHRELSSSLLHDDVTADGRTRFERTGHPPWIRAAPSPSSPGRAAASVRPPPAGSPSTVPPSRCGPPPRPPRGTRRRDRGGRRQRLAVEADITDRTQAEAAVQQTVERFGRLDTLVNNAGLMLLGPVVGADVEEWERMIAVNVRGLLAHDPSRPSAPAARR